MTSLCKTINNFDDRKNCPSLDKKVVLGLVELWVISVSFLGVELNKNMDYSEQ